MRGAIPPLPNTYSWSSAQFKKKSTVTTFPLPTPRSRFEQIPSVFEVNPESSLLEIGRRMGNANRK